MSEVTIVGAGLSGMIAAINLARNEHKVTILERESRIGGWPIFRPDPAGSWFDLEAMKRWTGVDISPAVKVIEQSYAYAYGKGYKIPGKASIKLYMVERGSRSTSIDTMLVNEALSLGVEIEYDHPVISRGDFSKLPPNSIVATGLQIESYQALDVPYTPLYFWFAKGAVPHDRTTVSMWVDDFSTDYAFNCTMNGVCFALLSQRDKPLKHDGKMKYTEMLYETEGIELQGWNDLEGLACPAGSIRNPRLFQGKKVLAGTLAGVIDPFLFYGMLGALVSGRIAAMAIDDRGAAIKAFRKATLTFYPSYAAKRAFNRVPDGIKKPVARLGLSMIPVFEELVMRLATTLTPGWRVAR